jgi:hypothetical protein
MAIWRFKGAVGLWHSLAEERPVKQSFFSENRVIMAVASVTEERF